MSAPTTSSLLLLRRAAVSESQGAFDCVWPMPGDERHFVLAERLTESGSSSLTEQVPLGGGDDHVLVTKAPQWYPGTLVMHRPMATTFNFLMHFDDGWQSLVGLPDPSVRLLHEILRRCTCERCMVVSDAGELLGPGGRVNLSVRGGES